MGIGFLLGLVSGLVNDFVIGLMFGFFVVCYLVVCHLVVFHFTIKNKKRMYIGCAALLIAILYLSTSNTIYSFLLYLADLTSIAFIKGRLIEIAAFVHDGMATAVVGKTTFRFYIYKSTWDSFLQHPIFGNFIFGNYTCIYDHTTILDLLAAGGILLFIPFVWFIRTGYKLSSCRLEPDKKKVLLASFLVYIYIATVDPILSSRALGLLLFAIPLLLENIERKRS